MKDDYKKYPAYIVNSEGKIEFKQAFIPLLRNTEPLGSEEFRGIPVHNPKTKLELKTLIDSKTLNWNINRQRGICLICGKNFEPSGRQSTCSVECRKRLNTLTRAKNRNKKTKIDKLKRMFEPEMDKKPLMEGYKNAGKNNKN